MRLKLPIFGIEFLKIFLNSRNIVIFSNKRSQAKVSNMYFYIETIWTLDNIYVHTGHDPQVHNWLTSGESILLLPSSVSDLYHDS